MLFVLVRFAYTPDTRGVGSIEDQTIDFINGQPLQFNLRYQSYIYMYFCVQIKEPLKCMSCVMTPL